LYNLLVLTYNINDYVRHISIFPDLLCIAALKSVVTELDKFLKLKQDEPITLFYDTTFSLGDFYVSTLCVKHILFEGEPVIPVAFFLHERKFRKYHETFLRSMTEIIPNLKKKSIVVLVTDREIGITNAVKTTLSNITILHCWNHIKRDIRFWVKSRFGKNDDASLYVDNASDLLECETSDNFEDLLRKLSQSWSTAFLDYFENEIQPSIVNYAGRWILESIQLYNPFSGITNNASESLNEVLKDFVLWKRQRIDCVILSLWHLQRYLVIEMLRGRARVGKFKLKAKFNNCSIDNEEIPLMDNIITPDNIVQYIKESGPTLPNINDDNHGISDKDCDKDLEDLEEENNLDISTTGCSDNLTKPTSQYALARLALENNMVTHLPNMGCL